MRLGIDFDNTLVQYDGVFHSAAVDEGLIPEHLPVNKTVVRDSIRLEKGPDEWTRLQGLVYGKLIEEANEFPGAREVLIGFRKRGICMTLISHKTRWPVIGPRWDLHAAARSWLSAREFFHEQGGENLLDEVWFEETREAKYRRIAERGCDLFLDDLPEFLLDPEFPQSARPILFDPMDCHAQYGARLERITSWRQLPGILTTLDLP